MFTCWNRLTVFCCPLTIVKYLVSAAYSIDWFASRCAFFTKQYRDLVGSFQIPKSLLKDSKHTHISTAGTRERVRRGGEKGGRWDTVGGLLEVNYHCYLHIHQEMSGTKNEGDRGGLDRPHVWDRNNWRIQYVWMYEKGKIWVKKYSRRRRKV